MIFLSFRAQTITWHHSKSLSLAITFPIAPSGAPPSLSARRRAICWHISPWSMAAHLPGLPGRRGGPQARKWDNVFTPVHCGEQNAAFVPSQIFLQKNILPVLVKRRTASRRRFMAHYLAMQAGVPCSNSVRNRSTRSQTNSNSA